MKISIWLTLLNISTLTFIPSISLATLPPLPTEIVNGSSNRFQVAPNYGFKPSPQISQQMRTNTPLLLPPNSNRFFEKGREQFEEEIRLSPETRQLGENNPLQIEGELREGFEEMLRERGVRSLDDLMIPFQPNEADP